MPKRYFPQKGFQEHKVIEYNVKKIKQKRTRLESKTIYLPNVLSLLILKDSTIKSYYTTPYMNSAKFENSQKFHNSASLASLMIANYNLNFIRSPHLLLDDPSKFVISNNLNFPQNLGKVCGLTKNQKFIELDYKTFCERVESILTNNLERIANNEETFYKHLPNEVFKKQAFKVCLKLKNELHKIESDPYYLHTLYEAINVLLTTNKNECSLKEDKLCQ